MIYSFNELFTGITAVAGNPTNYIYENQDINLYKDSEFI